MKKTILLMLCVAILAGLMLGAFLLSGEKPVENAGTAQNAPVNLTYQGVEYPMKRHLQTVLLIGTDGTEGQSESADGMLQYYNHSQADFLMLLVLDLEKSTTQIIQLNRDTMTEVPWLDVFGELGGTEVKQLCLSFNYGDGGENSCKNTVNAVSSLLFDAPIQSYIQVPMTAIPVINDIVGGVPVTIPEDLTMVDPAFVQGANVLLNGKQAEAFLRVRYSLPDDTNIARMARHRIYLDSFQKQAKNAYHSDSEFAQKLLKQLTGFLQSNMTAQQITDLIARLDQFEIAPVCHPEGKLKTGMEYYEFYVDEPALWELVKSVYCQ